MTALPCFARDRILVVTATAGFRHDSIETAERIIRELAQARNVDVVYARTEDDMRSLMTPQTLATMAVVLFANTTGDLPDTARESLLFWIRGGGTFVGVHSASDTWHSSPEYIEMLGGEFERHPAQTSATIFVDDATHPATAALPSPQVMFEEYYFFRNFDPGRVRLLLSLRNSPEDAQPGFFPLAWTKSHGTGRVLYTALGHRIDVWESAWFRTHIDAIIGWALDRPLPVRRRAVGGG